MKTLDEITARALLGNQRGGAALPAPPDDLAPFTDPAAPGEQALLDIAAACSLYATCGVTTTPTETFPTRLHISRCPPDEWAECSSRAAGLLEQLLALPHLPLLVEWMHSAERLRRRPPHALLPALLDRAARQSELRPLLPGVIDRRGAWLAAANPAWQFAQTVAPEQTLAPEKSVLWETGTREERHRLLHALRQTDPSRARQCVQETWTTDPAEERTRWLGLLATGLSRDDEPFLESCLDDRGSRVRDTAAELLARLPQSRLVARMIGRLEPLFEFVAGQPGSIRKLQRTRPATLTVRLPDSFDKTMLRDGVSEKPPAKTGQKQWWLRQMVACVPPSHWAARFAATPAELLAALVADFADAIVTGWRTAAIRHRDANWALPLILSPAGAERFSLPLLALVPEAERPALLAALPKQETIGFDPAVLLQTWSPPGERLSRALLARFPDRLLSTESVLRLHPALLAELEPALLDLSTKPYVGRSAAEALTILSLRRALHTEFAP